MNEILNALKGLGGILYQFAKENWTTAAIFGKAGIYQNIFANALEGLQKNILGNMGVDLGVDDFRPFGSVRYWDKIYKAIKDSNQQLGIANNLSKEIESSYKQVLPDAAAIGASFEDIAKEYQSFVESTGRNRAFNAKELYDLVEVRKAIGESAVNITSSMSLLGIGITRSVSGMKALVVASDKTGANFKQVFKTLSENIDVLYKLNFVNGVKGLEKMAEAAVRTKISMQSAVGFAEKIWEGSIEGAVETAAELQLLGGEFATMGDPFQLMYAARNKPEELHRQIHDLTASVASLNRETGEITVSALGMDRLRALHKITGVGLDELAKSARIAKKELDIKGMFDFDIRSKSNFGEILSKVAGFAEFDTQMGQYVVKLREGAKTISQLTMGDIQSLTTVDANNQDGVFKEVITSNMNVAEKIQRLIDELKLVVLGEQDYNRFDAAMTTMTDNFRENIQTTWKPFVDFLQNMMSSSFNSMMGIIDNINAGNISGAFQVMGDNIVEAVKSIGTVIWEGFKYLGSQLWAVAKWGMDKATGTSDILTKAAEERIRELRGAGDNTKADELQKWLDDYRNKGYGFSMPDPSIIMDEITPKENTSSNTNGSTSMSNPTIQINPNNLQGNNDVLINKSSGRNFGVEGSIGTINHIFDIPQEYTVNGVDSSGNKKIIRKISADEMIQFLTGSDKPIQTTSTFDVG